MPAVTEIEKLRPELLDKSVAELDRLMAEIEMAKAKKAEVEAEARRVEEHQEAVKLTDDLLRILNRLGQLGRVPPKLMAVLTRPTGEYVPGAYIKKPRS